MFRSIFGGESGGVFLGFAVVTPEIHRGRRVFAGYVALFGRDHPSTISIGCFFQTILWRCDLHDEGKRLGRENLEAARRLPGDNANLILQVSINLAAILCDDPARTRGDVAEAIRLFEDAATTSRRAFGPQHGLTLSSTIGLKSTRALLAQFDS